MQLNVFLEEPNCQIKRELQLALHSNKNKPQTSMAGVKSKLRLGTLRIQEAKKNTNKNINTTLTVQA